MAMVNEAYQHLCKQASKGEVASEVLQKVGQLAADVSNRNFPSASAIQAVRVITTQNFINMLHLIS